MSLLTRLTREENFISGWSIIGAAHLPCSKCTYYLQVYNPYWYCPSDFTWFCPHCLWAETLFSLPLRACWRYYFCQKSSFFFFPSVNLTNLAKLLEILNFLLKSWIFCWKKFTLAHTKGSVHPNLKCFHISMHTYIHAHFWILVCHPIQTSKGNRSLFIDIWYNWSNLEKISMAHVQGWHAQIEKWLKGNGRQWIARGWCIKHSKATLFHILMFFPWHTKHLHPWYVIFHQTYHHFPSKFEAIFLTKQHIYTMLF